MANETSIRVQAKAFFFEPWCSELKSDHPTSIRVVLGEGSSSDVDPLEVIVWDDGEGVTVWPPTGSRVFARATTWRELVPGHGYREASGPEQELDYSWGLGSESKS